MGNNKKKSVFETRRFKEAMKFVYGFGGAIVILGAMFKITHWPGATEMLVAGLTTEALIFIISSFEPLHEEHDWSKVYPELADGREVEEDVDAEELEAIKAASTLGLDRALAAAHIDNQLLESLGKGMKAIAAQADTMGAMMTVNQSAQKFADNLDKASHGVEQIAQASLQANENLSKAAHIDFSALSGNLKTLEENIQGVNQIYDGQVKGISAGIEVGKQTQNHLQEVLESVKVVAENAALYQQNMQQLSENLNRINQVYQQVLQQVESELPEQRKGIFERLLGLFSNKR